MLAAGAAFALRLAADPILGDRQPFVTFYLAIGVTAWWAGARPALFVLFCGWAAANWFFISPRAAFPSATLKDLVGSGLYLLVGLGFIVLTEWMRQAESRAATRLVELERAEAERRRSQRELQTFFDVAVVGMAQADPRTGRFLQVNDKLCAITGYTAAALAATTLAALAHPEDCEGVREGFARLVAGEMTEYATEIRYLCHDGAIAWAAVHASLLRDVAGVPTSIVAVIQDVTARRSAEQALAERTEELAAILDGAPCALWVAHDARCARVTGSRFANELLGVARGTNVSVSRADGSLTFRHMRDGRELSADELPLQRAIATGAPIAETELDLVFSDGRVRSLIGNAVPLCDELGRVRGAVAAFIDIDARKQAEAEREALLTRAERSRAEAEAANRGKDEFLAMLGHELRNPLSAVRNAVAVARRDEARSARALTIADIQTERLTRLVDDLLDVARITQGRIRLRREPTALGGIVERAVEETRGSIAERRHDLTVSLPVDPLPIEGDVVRLEQVVTNLLTNAARYTNPGGRIELRAERDGGDAVIRVRDTGIGIAPELLPHLFELFTQGDHSSDRVDGGLGVGLTVAKRLVELHGGTISAHSDGVGTGSTFEVRLPLLRHVTEAEPAPPPSIPTDRTRVLLVEDNPDAGEALVMLLELLGHDVTMATNGPSALDVLRTCRPDIALVDIGLPGMDGYEVAQRMRALGGVTKPILVALTGYGRDEDRQRAREAGFDFHLTKPVDLDALQDLVGQVGEPESRAARRVGLR